MKSSCARVPIVIRRVVVLELYNNNLNFTRTFILCMEMPAHVCCPKTIFGSAIENVICCVNNTVGHAASASAIRIEVYLLHTISSCSVPLSMQLRKLSTLFYTFFAHQAYNLIILRNKVARNGLLWIVQCLCLSARWRQALKFILSGY